MKKIRLSRILSLREEKAFCVFYMEDKEKTKKIIIITFMICAVVLAAFKLNQFYTTELLPKGSQTGTRAGLVTIRSSISDHFIATKGQYPEKLDDLVPVYLKHIPKVRLAFQWPGENTNIWKYDPTPDTDISAGDIDNTTAYIFNNKNGVIKVNHNGVDARGYRHFYEW